MSENEELAERMRLEDSEQFCTLVRMHLSFLLDLNAEDCDNNAERKLRAFKWNLPFSKKTKGSSKANEVTHLSTELVTQLTTLIDFLSRDENIVLEGIFRRTGMLRRQQDLKSRLTAGETVDLNNGEYSVHDCASVFKSILSELPEPLLTDAYYPAYCQVAETCGNEERLLLALQLLSLLLPVENRSFLRQVLLLLSLAAEHEAENRMSATNLATLFTPLLCPRRLSPGTLHAHSQVLTRVVAFMISQVNQVFDVPEHLATDIKAYKEKKERRKKSPFRQMNESICDGTTVNTVFTFVDRERTAQENGSNPTELALAQLYAHIQSLPDSAMKRRLIKNFNKKNGQGTPAVRSEERNKHRRSRSLRDSIKKHLSGFSKSVKEEHSVSPSTSPSKTPMHTALHRKRPQLKQELIKSSRRPPAKENVAPNLNISRSISCDALNNSVLEDASKPQKKVSPRGDETRSLKLTSPDISQVRDKRQVQQNNTKSDSRIKSPETPSLIIPSRKPTSARILLPRAARRSPPTVTSLAKALIPTSPPEIPRSRHIRRVNSQVRSQLNVSFLTGPSPPHSNEGRRSKNSSPPKRPSPEGFESTKPAKRASPEQNHSKTLFCTPLSVSSLRIPEHGLPVPTPTNRLSHATTPQSRRFMDALTTSTPAPRSACLLTPHVDRNSSMSPITRSAQKMPLAMQETMMTPRSRKPVVSLSGTDLCLNSLEPWTPFEAGKRLILEESEGSGKPDSSQSRQDSLSTTFRDYLYSRSVLTASPVDLSFSSRTDDYQSLSSKNSSLEEVDNHAAGDLLNHPMSNSLLFCLDGNDPNLEDGCSSHVCETAI